MSDRDGIGLQVLICTIADGIGNITADGHPRLPGVEYIVSWQRPDLRGAIPDGGAVASEVPVELPEPLRRDDFRVYVSPTRGLSRNRNHAVGRASAPLCLISDDDMRYKPQELRGVAEAFAAHPQADIIAFRIAADRPRFYPTRRFDLRRPARGWNPASCELAFRRVSAGRIPFDERFGLGSGLYPCGEESVWLHRALRAGLRGIFVPLTIGRHPGESTGIARRSEATVLRAQGAMLGATRPWWSLPRLPFKAWRSRGAGASPLRCMMHLSRGWLEGLRLSLSAAPEPEDAGEE